MDDLSRAFYELTFKVAFMERKATAFQDFFSSVMEKRYPGDFIRVRPWGPHGDRKNDGYIRTKSMLFQCYAPNEMDAATCISKITTDFNGALPHWRDYFSEWIFVHNSMEGLGPDVTKTLLKLNKTHAPLIVKHWGFEELRNEAMRLDENDLASLLGPAPTRSGMITLGLASLAPVLDQITRLHLELDADLRPVPANKLTQNSLSPSVGILLKAGMSRAGLVRRYFKLQPMLQDEIAESFRSHYAQLRGRHSPDGSFAELQRFAAGSVVPEPGTQEAVLAVLAFFFEECDIFERPGDGLGTTTP